MSAAPVGQTIGDPVDALAVFDQWYDAHESGDVLALRDVLHDDVEVHSLFRPEPARSRDAAVARVDACLGIAGRPQSATGQATLFTGVNAAAHLGQHLHGFPNAKLRQLLAAESVFCKVGAAGGRATFANAYPRPYLSYLDLPYEGPRAAPLVVEPRARRRLRPSASTCASTSPATRSAG